MYFLRKYCYTYVLYAEMLQTVHTHNKIDYNVIIKNGSILEPKKIFSK